MVILLKGVENSSRPTWGTQDEDVHTHVKEQNIQNSITFLYTHDKIPESVIGKTHLFITQKINTQI